MAEVRRYPLQPLMDLTGWTLQQINQICGCAGTEYRLRREFGVTERTADKLACTAGYHPYLVWPELLDDILQDYRRQCAGDSCDNWFDLNPKGQHRRFCSPGCRRRHNERVARVENRLSAVRKRIRRRVYYQQHHEYELARQRRYDQNRRAS